MSSQEMLTCLEAAARRYKHQFLVVHQMVEEEHRLRGVVVEPQTAVVEVQSQGRYNLLLEPLQGQRHLVGQLAEPRSTGSIARS